MVSGIIAAELRRRYSALIEVMVREGLTELARETAEVAVRQGLWADAGQRPVDYWPDGGHQPVYDPGDYWFVSHLEAGYPAIRAEIDAAVDAGRPGFAPVDEPLLGKGKWDQVVLYEAGRRNEHACARFPVTASIVEQIPEATTFGPGVVTLSWLEPGSHIVPHCGRTNAQIRVHLGLRVPGGASMRVGDQTLTWQEGRCLVFDDSYEHEVWHRGDQPRLVLLLDVLNPCLDDAQRARLLARRMSATDEIARFLAEHDIDRVETDERGVVLRPSAGMSALVRRYMAETGTAVVERQGRELRFEYATPIAAVVRAAWTEVLRRDDFGPDDDFAELGATSLDAVRIVARVAEDLGLDLSVRVLLEPRTVAGMVERVRRQAAEQAGVST